MRLAGWWVLALMSLSVGGDAQVRAAAKLLVLAKKDERLAIVDPATLKVMATVPVGGNPHEVIASPDGRTAVGFELRERIAEHNYGGRCCGREGGEDD